MNGLKIGAEIIVPVKDLVDLQFNETVILRAVRDSLSYAHQQFMRTTTTWTHKPSFRIEGPEWISSRAIGGSVSTDDETYVLVNQGAKPHPIFPRRAKRLRFMSVYRAKTKPRKLSSYPGGKSGREVYALKVYHPGFEGRQFAQEIADRIREEIFDRKLEAAMREIAARSRVPSKVLKR